MSEKTNGFFQEQKLTTVHLELHRANADTGTRTSLEKQAVGIGNDWKHRQVRSKKKDECSDCRNLLIEFNRNSKNVEHYYADTMPPPQCGQPNMRLNRGMLKPVCHSGR
jgi:hypothetical protein